MYQTTRLKQGDNKPIEYHLLTWNRDNQNMEDFDLTSYTVTFDLYKDEIEEPFIIDVPCTIDDAEQGYISWTLNTATIDLGMYRIAYIATDGTDEWRFPEYGFQNVFLTSDGAY